MQPIIKKENILFDVDAKDKADMIEQMVEVFDKEGYLSDKEQFHKDVLAREEAAEQLMQVFAWQNQRIQLYGQMMKK